MRDQSSRIEITCHDKGPVVRAEACQDDKYAALDVALDKLLERLRRQNDKKQGDGSLKRRTVPLLLNWGLSPIIFLQVLASRPPLPAGQCAAGK